MHYSHTLRAIHKPLIRFVGPRINLWKDAPHHVGPHPLTPPNLTKHVPQPEVAKTASSAGKAAPQTSSLEFSQLAARYRRSPISEAEMEAIESGGATHFF